MANPKFIVFALIIVSVSCSALAQLLLKIGMSKPETSASLAQGQLAQIVWNIGTNPWVVGGLGLYFFSAMVWLLVLARVELSFAYPFVGLGFILTMILGKFVMGDVVGVQRALGTLLVVGGILLIASE